MAVGEILVRELWFAAREGQERGEMRASGIADQRDALSIEVEFGGLGAQELHGCLHIADGAGPSLHARLHQPILDRKDGVAFPREVIAPMSVESTVAYLPAAAMHADQRRRLGEALRQIEVAEQRYPVVLGEHDIEFSRNFVLLCHCPFCARFTDRSGLYAARWPGL